MAFLLRLAVFAILASPVACVVVAARAQARAEWTAYLDAR